jgi:putative ABC transport system ATP-binding protein
MSKTIVQVKDLVKTYKKGKVKTLALKGISFDLKQGDFIALMGPSGSGKSTTLHQIGLLDKPTSGTVIIEGKDISQLTEKEKTLFRLNKIGFVFQQYELIPELTALENVYLPLIVSQGLNENIKNLAKNFLIELGLGERIDHYPSELSGGEQQRVSIARALIKNPNIILADEPTANLDSVSGKKIMSILKDLNKKYKITFIVVNHEREFEKYFDKIIWIRDGEISKRKA